MKSIKILNGTPRKGTIADLKAQRRFESRRVTILQVLGDAIGMLAIFAIIIFFGCVCG